MNTSKTPRTRGPLVLIGGREDKKGERRLLRRTVELSGAGRVAVIPTASRIPWRLGRQYVRAFRGLGVREVAVIDVRRPRDADRPAYLEAVRGADLVFFSGGDQTRLARVLDGTALLDEIRRAFERGTTVAGTSAGASAAGDTMIFDGDGRGLRKGRVGHGSGFGLLPGVTVDTHFVERGRYTRLAQALASGRTKRGVGLAENTALIIGPDGTAEVAGAGPVVVLAKNGATWSDYEETEPDRPVSVAGLELAFLSEGTRFDLNAWRVKR
jgi:cyanophycinase